MALAVIGTVLATRHPVRLRCAPLDRSATLEQVVAAVAGLPMPFVLAGRWGLPQDAPADDRAVIAGAAPLWVLPRGADPFEALDLVPPMADGEGSAGGLGHPTGAVGGGLVGWFGYGLGRDVERTLGPQPPRPEALPAAHLAWYGDVLRRDAAGTWWVEVLVAEPAGAAPDEAAQELALQMALAIWRARIDGATPLAPARLGQAVVRGGQLGHERAVAETVERIGAGELFQANVCLRIEAPLEGPAAGLVAPVLERTDPWFGGWIDAGHGAGIVSASPELFLRRRGRQVTTGPIKGTAPREDGRLDPAGDPAAQALAASAKDQAEHVMILDLMRNDLGRVCDYGSVDWDPEPRLEPHAGVWHLVSEVRGLMHEGMRDERLLRATFPPGSVTGAPKVQAQRVIAAVEGTAREVYTGAHGLASPVSGLELAVTIRTLEFQGDRAWVGAGGGIVADSLPGAELDEALRKARALVLAAGGAPATREHESAPGITLPGQRAADDAAAIPWMRSDDARPDPRSGVLDTILVEEGHGWFLDAHVARLRRSVAALGWPGLPEDLAGRLRTLAAEGTGRGRLRLRVIARLVTAQPGPPELEVTSELVPAGPAAPSPEPTLLRPFVLPGGLGRHKWADRGLVDAVTTRIGATPLLLDADGTILEAGWANVLWLEGGTLWTPPADGRILPGVTLAALRERLTPDLPELRETHRRWEATLAQLPLLITSARGVSVAALDGTPPAVADEAYALAQALAAQLTAPAG